MVTTGGWAYCEQVRPVARATRYTLLCGRYCKDGYLGPGLRSRRRLDWGDPAYLTDLAAKIRAASTIEVGGKLVLIGVSYSGFGVATLASHHPELRPDRLIVIDSYLDLVAREAPALTGTRPPRKSTQRPVERRRASPPLVGVDGLARLVRSGTELTTVWSVSEDERRFFAGATCDRNADAATLSRLARCSDDRFPPG